MSYSKTGQFNPGSPMAVAFRLVAGAFGHWDFVILWSFVIGHFPVLVFACH